MLLLLVEKIHTALLASSGTSNVTVPHPFERPSSFVLMSARLIGPENQNGNGNDYLKNVVSVRLLQVVVKRSISKLCHLTSVS